MVNFLPVIYHAKISRGNAMPPYNVFCHCLVQGNSQYNRVGKYVGDFKGIEEGGYLCLTPNSIKSFSNIKYNIPALTCCECMSQLNDIANPFSWISNIVQCVFYA